MALNIITIASVLVEPYLMENPSFRLDADWFGQGSDGAYRHGGNDVDRFGGNDGSYRHGDNESTHGTAEYRYTDEDREYVGYIADLVAKLSEVIGFDYEIRPTLDGSYGFERPDGSWDGIIGDVLEKRAAIGAAPTYVTSQRAKVVDFTETFMPVHATILLRNTHAQPLRTTSHPPSAYSASNQASAAGGVRSVKDLVLQSTIKYGTLQKGVLIRAFKKTNVSLYRTMWKKMVAFDPSVFTSTNEEGIERVRNEKEKYAFILPHTIGEYITRNPPCDLTTVGKFLLHSGYALVVGKDSAMRRPLNAALRNLAATGYLDELYRKWWGFRGGRSDCRGTNGGSGGGSLKVRSTQQKTMDRDGRLGQRSFYVVDESDALSNDASRRRIDIIVFFVLFIVSVDIFSRRL